jgi:hypothetical protein
MKVDDMSESLFRRNPFRKNESKMALGLLAQRRRERKAAEPEPNFHQEGHEDHEDESNHFCTSSAI